MSLDEILKGLAGDDEPERKEPEEEPNPGGWVMTLIAVAGTVALLAGFL